MILYSCKVTTQEIVKAQEEHDKYKLMNITHDFLISLGKFCFD